MRKSLEWSAEHARHFLEATGFTVECIERSTEASADLRATFGTEEYVVEGAVAVELCRD